MKKIKENKTEKTTFATHPEFLDFNKLTYGEVLNKGHVLMRMSISATKILYKEVDRKVELPFFDKSFVIIVEHVKRLQATYFEFRNEQQLNYIKEQLENSFPKGQKFVINSFETWVEFDDAEYFLFWERKSAGKGGVFKMVLKRIEKRPDDSSKKIQIEYFNKEPSFDIDKKYGKIVGDMQFEGCRYIAAKQSKGFLCD